jgi:hypothetical protein
MARTPVDDLKSTVLGVDATYGWSDSTGLKRLTFGAEALLDTGDVGGGRRPVRPSIDVVDDNALGFYAFGDYAWNAQSSVGVQ